MSLSIPISLCNKRDQNRIFAIIHLQRTKFAFSVYTLGQGESFEYDVSEKDPNKDSEIVKEKNNKNFFYILLRMMANQLSVIFGFLLILDLFLFQSSPVIFSGLSVPWGSEIHHLNQSQPRRESRDRTHPIEDLD